MCVCIALCTIVAHNIAQNRPDSFPPYPPDNHHSSDDVYLREGGTVSQTVPMYHIIQMNNNFTACVQSVRHQHAHVISARRSRHWSIAASITFCSKSTQVCVKRFCRSKMSQIFVSYMHCCITLQIL